MEHLWVLRTRWGSLYFMLDTGMGWGWHLRWCRTGHAADLSFGFPKGILFWVGN